MNGRRRSSDSFKTFVGIGSQAEGLLGRDRMAAAIVDNETGENSRKYPSAEEGENEGGSAKQYKCVQGRLC